MLHSPEIESRSFYGKFAILRAAMSLLSICYPLMPKVTLRAGFVALVVPVLLNSVQRDRALMEMTLVQFLVVA
jgi:hypothetical protein